MEVTVKVEDLFGIPPCIDCGNKLFSIIWLIICISNTFSIIFYVNGITFTGLRLLGSVLSHMFFQIGNIFEILVTLGKILVIIVSLTKCKNNGSIESWI